MSKMDGLRAMREARYERTEARRAAAPRTQRPPVAPPDPDAPATKPARTPAAKPGAKAKPAARAKPAAAAEPSQPGQPGQVEALCGHRNMGGRTCTRELGHTAKSHRYS